MPKLYTGPRVKVGTWVWYKGPSSGGDYRYYTRFQIAQILDAKTCSPRFLLRLLLPKEFWRDMSIDGLKTRPRYDYAVVDQRWEFCFPDTLKIRRWVHAWNEAKKVMERVERNLELTQQKVWFEVEEDKK
jgi:hypothetical protein